MSLSPSSSPLAVPLFQSRTRFSNKIIAWFIIYIPDKSSASLKSGDGRQKPQLALPSAPTCPPHVPWARLWGSTEHSVKNVIFHLGVKFWGNILPKITIGIFPHFLRKDQNAIVVPYRMFLNLFELLLQNAVDELMVVFH